MINIIVDKHGNTLKKEEGSYLIATLDGLMYETDTFEEMVAVVCGPEYMDADSAETRFHMRVKAAKQIGLFVMMQEEMANPNFDEKDEEQRETLIVYDERIGKIPYSYTGEVDYEIHGHPTLMRVECNETFIYSLEKAQLIAAWEKVGEEYVRMGSEDLDAKINEALIPFLDCTETVPLHKKISAAS